MDAFLQALRAYEGFNPSGWVAIYRHLPLWAAIACCVVGLALLLFGGGRMFRVLAGPAGALLGLEWTNLVLVKLRFPELADPFLPKAVGLALLPVGFLLPQVIVFLGAGVPLGLLGGELAGPADFQLGFAGGFFFGGLIALLFYRVVAALLSSAVGAWVLVIGALAVLHHSGGPATVVAREPWGVLAAAALFASAGGLYQLVVRPARKRSERQRLDFRQVEQRALEKRRDASQVDE